MNTLSEQDVIDRLRGAIHAAGSQKAFAQQHHISPMYINDVLHGRREPGQKVLDALGIERVVTYQERRPVVKGSDTLDSGSRR